MIWPLKEVNKTETYIQFARGNNEQGTKQFVKTEKIQSKAGRNEKNDD